MFSLYARQQVTDTKAISVMSFVKAACLMVPVSVCMIIIAYCQMQFRQVIEYMVSKTL